MKSFEESTKELIGNWLKKILAMSKEDQDKQFAKMNKLTEEFQESEAGFKK